MDKQALIAALKAIHDNPKAPAALRADVKQKLVNALGMPSFDEDKLQEAEDYLAGDPSKFDMERFQAAFEIVNRQRLKDEAAAQKEASDAAALAIKEAAAREEGVRLAAKLKAAAEELVKNLP